MNHYTLLLKKILNIKRYIYTLTMDNQINDNLNQLEEQFVITINDILQVIIMLQNEQVEENEDLRPLVDDEKVEVELELEEKFEFEENELEEKFEFDDLPPLVGDYDGFITDEDDNNSIPPLVDDYDGFITDDDIPPLIDTEFHQVNDQEVIVFYVDI
jgi:hypothetical protein